MRNLESSLTCSLIASELNFNEGLKPYSASDEEILQVATKNRFSRILLTEENSNQREKITHVAIIDKDSPTQVKRRLIRLDEIIAGNTPISKAIDILKDREFSFVLEHQSISKILTRSDLNKLPIRVYLVTLISHLEGLMVETIERVFPAETWLDNLPESQVATVRTLFDKKLKNDLDIKLIYCTTLLQKGLILKRWERVLESTASVSLRKYDSQVSRFNTLRNRLAHGLPPVLEDLDILRNNIYHNQPLPNVQSVQKLASVVSTMQAWIDGLAILAEDANSDGD